MNANTYSDLTGEILRESRAGLWRVELEEATGQGRLYADAVMNELLGTEEEMTPEERFVFHLSHVHPEDADLFRSYADNLAENRSEIVYRYDHPVTGVMYVRCSGKKMPARSGMLVTGGIHQDISDVVPLERDGQTEQWLAEMNSSLRREQVRQENYYRELLDVQNCGLMAYTLPDHRVIHMNAEALRMYGLTSVDEAQRRLREIVSAVQYPDRDVVEKLKALRTQDEGMVDYECIINPGESNECHALVKTRIFQTPSGDRAVVTTFIDISTTVTLKNALERAEAGSRAKTSFLFSMSHDLRTPMNAVIGCAELMEQHWEDRERSYAYLQKIKEASGFLLSLINNVLEMARIESGKKMLRETLWDVRELNETMCTIMETGIQNKHLEFHTTVNIQHSKVICDAMKVREIIINLLSNAVKYTPEGGSITMELEELPCDRPGCALYRTSVADTGIGISPDYQPHLFDSFTRERRADARNVAGTGLGLTIVKSFVDAMGGTIEVESEVGKGSKFTVILPHRLAPEEPAPAAQDDETAEQLAALAGKRILLVEDNELNAEIASAILEDAGLTAEVAADGVIALSMLKKAEPGYYDLILMDIQMPRMDGYQTTRAIRALPDPRAQIPILAMTANAFEEDRAAALAAGMNDHVAKPIEVPKLMRAMARVLRE